MPDKPLTITGTVFHVPIDVATTPAEGHCFVNRWWAVHPEKGVAWFAQLLGYTASEQPEPQSSRDEVFAKHEIARLHPDHEMLLLPAVYLGPAFKEMLRLRRAEAERILQGQKHA